MRLLFFFALTFYAYAFKPGGVAVLGTEFGAKGKDIVGGGRPGWDDLKNSLVFSWGFLEMMVWFWVSLRFSETKGLCFSLLLFLPPWI